MGLKLKSSACVNFKWNISLCSTLGSSLLQLPISIMIVAQTLTVVALHNIQQNSIANLNFPWEKKSYKVKY